MNSYKAVAVFTKAFFEAFPKGVLDAAFADNAPEKWNDPKTIKELMLAHYDFISQHYMESVFLAICRINYRDFNDVEAALAPLRSKPGLEFEDYMRVACKQPELMEALKAEYQRNFSCLLAGHFATPEEHLADCTTGTLSSYWADEPMTIHLLVRAIVKAYAAGLKEGSVQQGQQFPGPLHMPTVHSLLLENVNLLVNSRPLDTTDDDPVELFQQACGGREENVNVVFNALEDAMKDLALE